MRSFYDYVLSQRQDQLHSQRSLLCEAISHDPQFPKHEIEYGIISSYLEDYGEYIETMDLFDELWDDYLVATKQTDGLYRE